MPFDSAKPLRVASFNIRYGGADDGLDRWEMRAPRALDYFGSLEAHLVGLQEAMDFQLEAILSRYPRYKYIGVGREDGFSGGEFAAVLYDATRLEPYNSGTFWFSDTPNVPGSTHWGNVCTRICTWAEFEDRGTHRRFHHYNLHIDHESHESRLRSVEMLLTRIAVHPEGIPVVVTGDFNAGEQDPTIERMRQGGLRDTYRMIHPDATDAGTFNGFAPEFGPDKIDYIFVGQDTEVLDASIERRQYNHRWPSDHAAVVATIRL